LTCFKFGDIIIKIKKFFYFILYLGGKNMPSTLLHLAFAELVYPSFDIDHINFLSGNLIPDETADKKVSHYRVHLPNSRFQN
jgi:hypothetical protein